MATLSQLGDAATTELRRRVDQFASAVEDDGADLGEVSGLAQAVVELAELIVESYSDLEQVLQRGPGSEGGERVGGERQPSEHGTPTVEDLTKEELLDQAREANIEGRSSMSKEELAEAVEAEQGLTKDELLERARDAGIEGRSSMTKDELREALTAANA